MSWPKNASQPLKITGSNKLGWGSVVVQQGISRSCEGSCQLDSEFGQMQRDLIILVGLYRSYVRDDIDAPIQHGIRVVWKLFFKELHKPCNHQERDLHRRRTALLSIIFWCRSAGFTDSLPAADIQKRRRVVKQLDDLLDLAQQSFGFQR